MRSKLFALVIVLLIGNLVFETQAYIKSSDLNASSFVIPPKPVIDVSLEKDKPFTSKALINTLFFSAGMENDTVYVWKAENITDPNPGVLLWKRTLDAKTLESKDNDTSIMLDNANLSELMNNLQIVPGYIGFATTKDTGEGGAKQLYFSFLQASATAGMSPIEVLLANNSEVDVNYNIQNVVLQDDIFYIFYSESSKVDPSESFSQTLYKVYLQGIKVKDRSLLYPRAVKITNFATYSKPNFRTLVNATSIIVAWVSNLGNSISQATINITDGNITQLKAPKAVSDYSIKEIFGIFSSNNSSRVIVTQRISVPAGSNATNNYSVLMVYFDDDAANNKTLDFGDLDDLDSFSSGHTFNLADGMAVVVSYSTTDERKRTVFRLFDYNGKPLDSLKKIASDDERELKLFSDTNSSIWVGACDYDYDFYNILINKCYLGELLA